MTDEKSFLLPNLDTNVAIGDGKPVFIVAEIGINHNGDLHLAKQMMNAAKDAGADSVKFQSYKTEDFLKDPTLTYEYQSLGETVLESQIEMFRRYELDDLQVHELKLHADKLGIIFHSTPTGIEGVDLLVKENVPVIKNGSDFLTNTVLLEYMAKTGLPVVIATGMAIEEEIEQAIEAVRSTGNSNLVVLHCNSAYPSDDSDINLQKMLAIRDKFNTLVGFSDHSVGNLAAVGAVALGACWIEKHFTLNKNLAGPDHRFSSDPAEFSDLVRDIRRMEAMRGKSNLHFTQSEAHSRIECRLSCISATELSAGHVLGREDFLFARPQVKDGYSPAKINDLVGRILSRDVKRYQPFKASDLQ